MKRIGVFLCHCQLDFLPGAVTEQAIEAVSRIPDVVYATKYEDMCLEPGLEGVKRAIEENKLDGVVLTSCTPSLHQELFLEAINSAGLNSYQMEIAGLKPEVWSSDGGITAEKVSQIIAESIEKLRLRQPPVSAKAPITKRALVIGGGIAGIQCALDIADGGYEVILVEKNPSIGGHMIQHGEVFPTLDCPQCIMTPKMVEAGQHPNINLMAYSEVEGVSGEIGNFQVKIRRKATYVDWDKCTGCGECSNVCPVEIYSDFERGIANQKAIYKPFGQAVPAKFTIEKRGRPPCRHACPAGVNVQGYIALISQGKFSEALALIRERNPFAAVCGRVCHSPCEEECNRGDFDEPIAIRALKRCASEYGAISEETVGREKNGQEVAIIGAGPAGLTAASDLAKMGYSVTVFEASSVAGGMLQLGIPEYRLPREAVQSDIDEILKQGVEVKFNSPIGPNLTLSDLKKKGYQAIFLATGCQVSQKIGIPGEESEGVIHALDFLKRVNSGAEVKLGKKVVVIGGGNTAIDASRVALRLGAKEVTIVYRRSRAEMPAIRSEIEEAEREGIKLNILASPVRIISEDGRLTEIECVPMELGEPDASGRRRPIPIKGSEFTMDVDNVIIATGQVPDFSFLREEDGIEVEGGKIVVDSLTLATSAPGIFAGGDLATGPASVVSAVAQGHEAAVSIDRYLKGEDLTQGREEKEVKVAETPGRTPLETEKRQPIPTLSMEERIKGFSEVEMGLDQNAAMEEAKRCLSCGGCSECLSCEQACQAEAIRHQMVDRYEEVEVGAIVVATGFELLPKEKVGEYAPDPDILNGLQFERLLSPGGPTAGVVKRPSDGKIPEEVVFVSCVGSRDPQHHLPYCSRVCCMYLVKQAMLYKHATPDGQAYIFYMDTRTTGKGYEEFVQRAIEEEGVLYLRGKASRIFREGDKLKVFGVDTLTGKRMEVSCDLVVLGLGIVPTPGTKELAQKLGILTDKNGFIVEAHPKVRPLETTVPGIFICGVAQGCKDIPDSVAQGSGAASKVLALFSRRELELERV